MQKRSFLLSLFLAVLLAAAPSLLAQSTTATLSGTVVDSSDAVIPGVKITLVNVATSAKREVNTDSRGDFTIALLPPGTYSLRATREQFSRVEIPNIRLNTSDERAFKIKLKVGAANETVSVDATKISVDTSSGVSTVVDSNFVSELPLKGRSFQSLLLMTPGVVNVTGQEAGQISVNGLRTNANYWTVDGVSANVGVGIGGAGYNVNQTFTGAIPGFNAFGATNGMISVDALQEFKVQTSTYSAEFGRQPGGQVQLTTRSGSNQFHGVLYDYLRNDIMEANDWFNDFRDQPKPKTRFNDFGGTFGGPIVKDRTFFFFSYEGMRYRQPSTDQTVYVPSLSLRNDPNINPSIRALLNAFPLPTGLDEGDGTAQYSYPMSSPMNMDSYSIRLDQIINSKWTAFGRYNYSPSNQQIWSLNQLQSTAIDLRTTTVGLTGVLTPRITDQFTVNYSTSGGNGNTVIEPIGGAVVPTQAALYGGTVPDANTMQANWSFLGYPHSFNLSAGDDTQNKNRSFNMTDNVSWAKGAHSLKFGVDFRYLAPRLAPMDYSLNVGAYSVQALESSTMDNLSVYGFNQATIISKNVSLYVQDAWKVSSRLSLDLGLRWEVNPPPHGTHSDDLIYVQGWENPSTMTIAPAGTPGYATDYHAFAPRLGASYELFRKTGWETLVRGGFGSFYDLGSATAGYGANGFRSGNFYFGVPFPFSNSVIAPPPPRTYPTPPYDQYASGQALVGLLDNWKTPTTYQWNFGIQQSLGTTQFLTVNYVGNAARRLARSYNMTGGANGYGNPNFPDWASILITRNDPGYGDSSDYNGLQVQYQRRMSHGLQVMSNYTWSHAIDTASQDTDVFDYVFSSLKPTMTRGNSDNDRRQIFNLAMTYQVPSFTSTNTALRLLNNVFLKGWSWDNMFTAQTGAPLSILFTRDTAPFDPNGVSLRPDLVPNVPIWINDPTAPGGKYLNQAAFALPANAMGPAQLLTQGDLPRNSIYAPGIWQLDTGIGRDFRLTERFKLQYRAQLFNALNHPNFGGYDTGLGFYSPQYGNYPTPANQFGRATTMSGTTGQGGSLGMIPLFSTGGPRSVQMAMKLVF